MLHTSDGPYYMKNERYMKKRVFLIFRVAWCIKSMQHGYSLDEELNFTTNKCSHSKFDKNVGR